MDKSNYLHWLINRTKTTWWHDSGDPTELDIAIENGASGVTTNPVLSALALKGNADRWKEEISTVLSGSSLKGNKVYLHF